MRKSIIVRDAYYSSTKISIQKEAREVTVKVECTIQQTLFSNCFFEMCAWKRVICTKIVLRKRKNFSKKREYSGMSRKSIYVASKVTYNNFRFVSVVFVFCFVFFSEFIFYPSIETAIDKIRKIKNMYS